MLQLLAWITWDPNRVMFTIPYFNHPVTWYGFLFALGFLFGFLILTSMFRQKLAEDKLVPPDEVSHTAHALTDKMTWYVVIGSVIGARLGHVFFYDWPRYRDHWVDIFKVWEGGLASHGGLIGTLVAVTFFRFTTKKKFPSLSFLTLLDMLSVPAAICAGVFIRIGNFVNQEIYGIPTTVPWAVIFKHPIDGGAIVPRHPAQLYEAGCYFIIFIILYLVWKNKRKELVPGTICGLFFILIFGSRMVIEFIKTPQSLIINESFLTMGQYLSLPVIFLGIVLCLRNRWVKPY